MLQRFSLVKLDCLTMKVIDIDEIFVKLVEPSEYWDGMTKQC